jgi:hypothetical protein
MTESERAAHFVEKLRHEMHLKFQREMLRRDATTLPDGQTLECSEVRGVRRKMGASEIKARSVFRPEWFTHLRPNFWKAYFDTLLHCR